MALPANSADLETSYTTQNKTDVETNNGVRVEQTATSQYAIHQFKDYCAGSSATFTWEGQTNMPPVLSTVYLQIYNINTTTWVTIDSDNSSNEDTDFTLTANVADLTNYKDGNGMVTCRVYQLDI